MSFIIGFIVTIVSLVALIAWLFSIEERTY